MPTETGGFPGGYSSWETGNSSSVAVKVSTHAATRGRASSGMTVRSQEVNMPRTVHASGFAQGLLDLADASDQNSRCRRQRRRQISQQQQGRGAVQVQAQPVGQRQVVREDVAGSKDDAGQRHRGEQEQVEHASGDPAPSGGKQSGGHHSDGRRDRRRYRGEFGRTLQRIAQGRAVQHPREVGQRQVMVPTSDPRPSMSDAETAPNVGIPKPINNNAHRPVRVREWADRDNRCRLAGRVRPPRTR